MAGTAVAEITPQEDHDERNFKFRGIEGKNVLSHKSGMGSMWVVVCVDYDSTDTWCHAENGGDYETFIPRELTVLKHETPISGVPYLGSNPSGPI